ncbi:MAG: hypothetical protein IPN76_34855 [Saprospiraceae bacterium]|nr:hypothetical protein [Saprospiraceae bacterium]
MLFSKGTKVNFRHTDDEEVKGRSKGAWFNVYMSKYDMEIPALARRPDKG